MEKIKQANFFSFTPVWIFQKSILLICLAILGLRIILSTSYLPETGGVSINVVYGIERLLHGSPLYTNPEEAPFPIIQYMPLHFRAVEAISRITGSENNVRNVILINRLFCLIIDILCSLMIAGICRKTIGLKENWSWTMAMIYFCCIPAIIFARVDNLYLIFFCAATGSVLKALAARKNESNEPLSREAWLHSGLFTALAMIAKQTGIFTALFISLYWLLAEKDLRTFMRFSLVTGIAFITLLFITISGSAKDMILNVIDGVKNGVNLKWFTEVIIKNYFLKHSFLIAAGWLSAILLIRNRGTSSVFNFTGLGICFYFITGSIAALKAGSGPNYFLEFITLFLLGSAALLASGKITQSQILPYAIALLPFFAITAFNDKGWGDLSKLNKSRSNYENAVKTAEYILPRLKKDEWVLTGFHKENQLNLLLSDRALFPCREVALNYTYPNGIFHFRAFGDLLSNKKVTFLVQKKGATPKIFLEKELNGYLPDTSIGPFVVYRLQ